MNETFKSHEENDLDKGRSSDSGYMLPANICKLTKPASINNCVDERAIKNQEVLSEHVLPSSHNSILCKDDELTAKNVTTCKDLIPIDNSTETSTALSKQNAQGNRKVFSVSTEHLTGSNLKNIVLDVTYNQGKPCNICKICGNTSIENGSLLLKCLHVFCSKCIMKRQHFRFRSSLSNDDISTFQDEVLFSPFHKSFEKLGIVPLIPDEAFENLEKLKEFIASNPTYNNKLAVKCPSCSYKSKATLMQKYLFVAMETESRGKANEYLETLSNFCSCCEEGSIAIGFCKDCDEHLCNECACAHKRVKMTKSHALVLFNGATMKNLTSIDSSLTHCKIHPNEEMKLFCETCNKLTCRDCQLLFHRDHKYLFVSEAAKSVANNLKKMRQEIDVKSCELTRILHMISSQIRKVKESHKSSSKDIIVFHKLLQDQITAKCLFFLDRLHAVSSKRCKALSDQIVTTNREAIAARDYLNFIDFATEKQNKLPLLNTHQMIYDHLKAVIDRKHEVIPETSTDIRFVPNSEIMKFVSMKLGSIVPWDPISKTTDVTPEYCNVRKESNQRQATANKNSMTSQIDGVVQAEHQAQNDSSSSSGNQSINTHTAALVERSEVDIVSTSPSTQPTQSEVATMNWIKSCVAYCPKDALGTETRDLERPGDAGNYLLKRMSIARCQLESFDGTREIVPTYADPVSVKQHVNENLNSSPTKRTTGNRADFPASTINNQLGFVERISGIPSSTNAKAMDEIAHKNNGELPPSVSMSENNKIPAPQEPPEDLVKASSELPRTPSSYVSSMAERLVFQQAENLPTLQGLPENARATIRQHTMILKINSTLSSSAEESSREKRTDSDVQICDVHSKVNLSSPLETPQSLYQNTVDLSFSPPSLVKLAEYSESNSTEAPTCSTSKQFEESSQNSMLETNLSTSKKTPVRKLINLRKFSQDNEEEDDIIVVETYEKKLCSSSYKSDSGGGLCAVCNNGGHMFRCYNCRKVFHAQCHIPEILPTLPVTWQCTLCTKIKKAIPSKSRDKKRKHVEGLDVRQLQICEKLTLQLYCHPQSKPFHYPDQAAHDELVVRVTQPMDLSQVKKKLLTSNHPNYNSVNEFFEDIQLIFSNCIQSNGELSSLGNTAKELQKYFLHSVLTIIPSMKCFKAIKSLKNSRRTNSFVHKGTERFTTPSSSRHQSRSTASSEKDLTYQPRKKRKED